MGDNINIGNEQRQFNGGNGANNNNSVSRKKANNGKRERKPNLQIYFYSVSYLTGGGSSGGDLAASPKYNKSNSRGYNKEIQQQRQYRGNNREQRGGGNPRYRNTEQNNPNRVRLLQYC